MLRYMKRKMPESEKMFVYDRATMHYESTLSAIALAHVYVDVSIFRFYEGS